ncbi:MAG: hypothetical protein ACKV22_39540 [Bryobacteraceae bacterium]
MKWLLFWLALPLAAGDLRVGRAAVKITPPAGMPMAGYYSIRLNEGVHDDLFAKAIVLEKDGAPPLPPAARIDRTAPLIRAVPSPRREPWGCLSSEPRPEGSGQQSRARERAVAG